MDIFSKNNAMLARLSVGVSGKKEKGFLELKSAVQTGQIAQQVSLVMVIKGKMIEGPLGITLLNTERRPD